MTNNKEKNAAKYKAGIFIISSIILLIFSIIWLKHFCMCSKMSVMVEFSNPGPISKGVMVYYKGINIGKVKKVQLSSNLEHTYVYLDFFKDDIKIPRHSTAEIKTEGITGLKYIDIESKDITSGIYLKNGEIIIGRPSFDLSKLQKLISEDLNTTQIKNIADNLDKTLSNTAYMSTKMKSILIENQGSFKNILKSGSETANNVKLSSDQIRLLLSDPELRTNLKDSSSNIKSISGRLSSFMSDKKGSNTITNLNELLDNTNRLINHWDNYSTNIYNDIERTKIINNASCAFAKAGITAEEASIILGKLEENGLDKDLGNLIVDTLKNTSSAAKSVQCTSNGVNDMLSKRFLLLKLLFGKPGKYFENCKQNANSTQSLCK